MRVAAKDDVDAVDGACNRDFLGEAIVRHHHDQPGALACAEARHEVWKDVYRVEESESRAERPRHRARHDRGGDPDERDANAAISRTEELANSNSPVSTRRTLPASNGKASSAARSRRIAGPKPNSQLPSVMSSMPRALSGGTIAAPFVHCAGPVP